MRLCADSEAALIAAFGPLGEVCPDRLERTKFDRELYCVRRYLFTLAATHKISFPLVIEKSEAPDFTLNDGLGRCFGIEQSEATNQADQREMTLASKSGVTFYLQGSFGGRGGRGFTGNEPERLWLDDVGRSILNKAGKKYATRSTRLLLYSNSNGGSHFDAEKAADLLKNWRDNNGKRIREAGPFEEISIIKGDRLVFDIFGACEVLPICRN